MRTFSLTFGCMVEPLKKQIEKQGFSLSDFEMDKFEKINKCLLFLKLHGILPESVLNRGFDNLLNEIKSSIEIDILNKSIENSNK